MTYHYTSTRMANILEPTQYHEPKDIQRQAAWGGGGGELPFTILLWASTVILQAAVRLYFTKCLSLSQFLHRCPTLWRMNSRLHKVLPTYFLVFISLSPPPSFSPSFPDPLRIDSWLVISFLESTSFHGYSLSFRIQISDFLWEAFAYCEI